MKKLWMGLITVLAMSLSSLALTQTGMPALDDLYTDIVSNGPLTRKLDFSDDQKKNIKEYIEKKAETLREVRDDSVAAEKKVERKEKKGADKKAAVASKNENAQALHAARDEAFKGLKDLMSEKQYNALKAWRAEGKAKAN